MSFSSFTTNNNNGEITIDIGTNILLTYSSEEIVSAITERIETFHNSQQTDFSTFLSQNMNTPNFPLINRFSIPWKEILEIKTLPENETIEEPCSICLEQIQPNSQYILVL